MRQTAKARPSGFVAGMPESARPENPGRAGPTHIRSPATITTFPGHSADRIEANHCRNALVEIREGLLFSAGSYSNDIFRAVWSSLPPPQRPIGAMAFLRGLWCWRSLLARTRPDSLRRWDLVVRRSVRHALS